MNFEKKIRVINANIFASSSVRSVSRTDHGADDEGDAAVEVDGALQLVVLVHAGRHLPSVRPSPSHDPSLNLCMIAAHVQTDLALCCSREIGDMHAFSFR